MAAESVPRATKLSEVYHPEDLPAQTPRWTALTQKFEATYARAPDFVARSPGRVNVIGEHIDYSLYPVLPMAITADAIIAVSSTPAPSDATTFKIELANVLGDRFSPAVCEVALDGDVEIDATAHHWTNYFRCGLRGALSLLRKKRGALRPVNMKVLMDGNVPVGGGLSSSAAFTTASALAVLIANGEAPVDKMELTELAIVAERAVGVNAGGMDQAASVLSKKGSALQVTFSPSLHARPVSFPATDPPLTFLIAQSYVTSEKHTTAPIHYNLRVAEVSMAAAYLHASTTTSTALPTDSSPLGVSLHGVAAGRDPQTMLRLVDEVLTREEGYTRDEIASVLGVSVPDLEARFMTKFPVRAERFMLRQRARHVYSETARVDRFAASLAAGVSGEGAEEKDLGVKLGGLMNETQASCRDLYDCSAPEIEQICAVARAAGAYGSRLTGAGWGGCTIHLVPADRVGAVKQALTEGYYEPRGIRGEAALGEALVVSKPGSGSYFVEIPDFEAAA